MSYDIKREAHVHGKLWAKQAAGFFSDPNMARDYVAAIMRLALKHNPSAIADLGGGTGFVLEQLIAAGLAENIKLVNIDTSDSQLAMCQNPRITPMKGTLESFRRVNIMGETGSLMLISRSVLQYGGILKQKPWLNHVRSQMKPGEWFVHQSGCEADVEGALALDVLFEQMGVGKWVPHKEAFVRLLVQAGFEVTDDFTVPAVEMASEELAVRYGVAPDVMAQIEADLRRTCSNRPDLVKFASSGFVFQFPYRVFLCKAVSSG